MKRWVRFAADVEVMEKFEEITRRRKVEFDEMLRHGLALILLCDAQRLAGRPHIGFVSDKKKLDVEVVGILENDHAPDWVDGETYPARLRTNIKTMADDVVEASRPIADIHAGRHDRGYKKE